MSAINPINGARPPLGPQQNIAADKGASSSDASNFGKMLKDGISKLDSGQKVAAGEIENLLSGKSQDVLPVITSVAKADLSFKLLIGVRNKVVEAYKQTMNMQV